MQIGCHRVLFYKALSQHVNLITNSILLFFCSSVKTFPVQEILHLQRHKVLFTLQSQYHQPCQQQSLRGRYLQPLQKMGDKKPIIAVSASVGGFLFLVIIFILTCYCYKIWRKRRNGSDSSKRFGDELVYHPRDISAGFESEFVFRNMALHVSDPGEWKSLKYEI